jgi:flagellar M-ring protein FliF
MDDSEAVSIAKFVMKSVPELQMKNISIVDDRMHSYDLTGSSSSSSEIFRHADAAGGADEEDADRAGATGFAARRGNGQRVRVRESGAGFRQENPEFRAVLPACRRRNRGHAAEQAGELQLLRRQRDHFRRLLRALPATACPARSTRPATPLTGNSGDNTLTYNYELNEIQTKLEKAQGTVKDLSVSVLINSKASGAKKAASSASKLVANAIGVKKNYITVSSLPFVQSAGGSSFSSLLQASQSAGRQALLLSILKIVIPCLTILLVAVLVLRHLKRKRKDEEEAEALDMDVEEGEAPRNAEGRPVKRKPVTNEDLADDLMQSKSGEAEKVEKLVEEYPDAAVQILRNWLTEN